MISITKKNIGIKFQFQSIFLHPCHTVFFVFFFSYLMVIDRFFNSISGIFLPYSITMIKRFPLTHLVV